MTSPHATAAAAAIATATAALPTGSRIASFEIEAVIARGPTTFVYLAQDLTRGMPVAIKEYAPARRIAAAPHEATDPLVQRGLQAFMAEARMLAACHHPSLVRVEALLDSHGTAYRVMPFYKGLSLAHVRTGLARAPDDATLRAWGADLVGALQAMHNTGHAHGGVSPENILLLADDRPLLFGAGSASHRVGSDLVESLLADFGLGGAAHANHEPDPKLLAAAASGVLPDKAAVHTDAAAEAVADDMRALASVLRFCISGEALSASSAASSPSAAPSQPVRVAPPARPRPAADPAAAAAAALGPEPEHVVPQGLFAEAVHSDDPDPDPGAPIVINDTADAPLPDAWFANTPVPVSPSALPPTGPPVSPPEKTRPLIPERWHIPLWVGLIALTGVAVLAVMSYVMGGWNRMPPIDFDRSLQTAPASAEPLSAASTSTSASASASLQPPVPASAPAQPSRRSQTEPDKNKAVPVPVPVPLPLASDTSASDAAPQTTAPLTEPQETPAAGVPASAQAAQKKEATVEPQKVDKTAAQNVPPKQPTQKAQPTAAVRVTTPLAACGARTNFALERCMQIQCETKKWALHPQCISRRAG